MTKTEEREKRKKLAIMLACWSYLHYSGILTDCEADKVFGRIRKFQDKHEINISNEEIDSVDFIYKDKENEK